MNLSQAIKTLEEWESLCVHNDDGTDEDSHELLEALRVAIPIMQSAALDEKRREITGAVCANCGRWNRDFSTRGGGYCPIPARGREGPKYRSRAMKACINFIPKPEEEKDGN